MPALKIRKVGNSLGVIFPKDIQEALNISEGDMIDATATQNNTVVLDSKLTHHSKWKFKNTDLTNEDSEWLNADLENEDDESPRR